MLLINWMLSWGCWPIRARRSWLLVWEVRCPFVGGEVAPCHSAGCSLPVIGVQVPQDDAGGRVRGECVTVAKEHGDVVAREGFSNRAQRLFVKELRPIARRGHEVVIGSQVGIPEAPVESGCA